MIKPVKKASARPSIDADVDAETACAETLRLRVIRGDYEAGARLPAERVLAEELGVSRGTVRNALATLTTQGLLQVRQGSGYTVCGWQRVGGPELLAALAETRSAERLAVARDLLAMRRALAMVVLERLSEVRFDVRPIRRAVDAFGLGAEAGMTPEEASLLDIAVLTSVVEATGSIAYQLSLNPITQVLARLPWLRDAMYATPTRNSAGYDALVAWLTHPDASALPVVRMALEDADVATLEKVSPKRASSRKGGAR